LPSAENRILGSAPETGFGAIEAWRAPPVDVSGSERVSDVGGCAIIIVSQLPVIEFPEPHDDKHRSTEPILRLAPRD
jgi:hypothetical protein